MIYLIPLTPFFLDDLIKDLTALFGTEWAIENLIPSIIEIREHKSYLRRLTALQACAMMATVMDQDAATLEVLPLILEMATDFVSSLTSIVLYFKTTPSNF